MASWQAHLISFVLRHVLKPRLARASSVEQTRAAFRGSKTPLPPGCTIHASRVGGIPGEWVTSSRAETAGTLLYLHGGGYVACSPYTYRPITTAFACGGLRTFAPDYRLAPEHRFPAGLDDAVSVYRALLTETEARRIVLAGDSAGGGLSLALLLSLQDQNLPLPAAAVLFSPLTDLTISGASARSNSHRCAMFSETILQQVAGHYLGERDPRLPLASPLFAMLQRLPPMLIHVGADETLLDDSLRLVERLRAVGTEVQSRVWSTVPHVFQLFHRLLPEGRESLGDAIGFLREQLRNPLPAPVPAQALDSQRADASAAATL
jgi:acetyl esterase/lipase